MRSHAARLCAIATALVLLSSGCGAEAPPPPPPEPKLRYGKIPEDLCTRLQLENMLKRFDLSPRPDEPDSLYRTESDYWYEYCDSVAQAEDGRFATRVGVFRPYGAIGVRVFFDVDYAKERYKQDVDAFFDRQIEVTPGSTTTDFTGWWDHGRTLKQRQALDPETDSPGDFKVTRVQVTHAVRHDNLVIMAHHDALCPPENTDEVMTLLHDLTAALIDETVSHLDG